MFKSESIKEIATALVAAQKTMSNAVVNSKNGHFNNEYADLPAVREAVLGPLNAQGIAIVQVPSIINGQFTLVTMLMHAPSGEYIGGEHPLPTTGTPQQIGSAITYARRQDGASIAFIAADNDDDAEASEGRPDTQISRTTPPPKKPTPAAEFVKLEPQALPFDSDFLDWGTRLAAQLNAATSEGECAMWWDANQLVMATAAMAAPAIVTRLTAIANREFPSAPKVVQQKKKTDARDGTSAKSAAGDLDAYRLDMLKAKTSAEAAEILKTWKPALATRGDEIMDQAVAMYEARVSSMKKTEDHLPKQAA